MDRLIRRFEPERNGDLRLVPHRGVAYQKDMSAGRVAYDASYLDHYRGLEGTPIAIALDEGRTGMLERHAAPGARVLDVGAGSGAFVRAAREKGFVAFGFDVNPATVKALEAAEAFATDPNEFDVVTFWDSLEHIENPESTLKHVRVDGIVLVAIPIFDDLRKVRESKHYKPGEHLYYFTSEGFVDWMAMYGFRLLETSAHEVDAGRESIGAFAFRRDLPGYHEHVVAYQEIHATRFYGNSATELHLDAVAQIVKRLVPNSILDYGCGRSDLVAHFWKDGARRIARYDPGIPLYRRRPKGMFDLVFCCDVMEHIPIADVDRVLSEVKESGNTVLFTISLKLARAKLPDGRNSHVTILRETEWRWWLESYFGSTYKLPSSSEFELVVLAGAAEVIRQVA